MPERPLAESVDPSLQPFPFRKSSRRVAIMMFGGAPRWAVFLLLCSYLVG